MKQEAGVPKASRQCWECLKRRLVCDYTLPHCKKCAKNGKTCPGYDEQKPLQWVEPGKVTSRKRRKAPSLKYQTKMVEAKPEKNSTKIEDPDGDAVISLAKMAEKYRQAFIDYQGSEARDHAFIRNHRDRIEHVINEAIHEENTEIFGNFERDPIKGLERMLHYMDLEDLPRYNLQSESCEVVQAVQYFNTRIYPEQCLTNDFAPNPHIMYFPPAALHLLPPSVHHIIICLSLNHFVCSLPAGTGKHLIPGNWSKMYHHRGVAIKELSYKIGQDKTRCSDGTITSVLMFLCIELQQQGPTKWRTHSDGLMQMLDLRGGMMNLYRANRHLHPTIVIFVLIVVFANSTSPASDQIILDPSVDQNIADVTEIYEELFPHVLCPPSLYQETVRINYLRYQASRALFDVEESTDVSLKAVEILERIETFSVEDWAQPGKNYEDWYTIGMVFKYSLAVFCIMSFQSLTILPNTVEMNQSLTANGDDLLKYLKKAVGSKRLKKFLAWPLVVAGVQAIHQGDATKAWIEEALDDLGRFTGTNCPLKIRAILRRYWQREEPGWEECFNQPHAFLF